MNKVYLHHQTKFNLLYKVLTTLLSVFFLYGFYKNGLKIYFEYEKNLYLLLKPLIFLLISLLVSFVFNKINHEKFLSYNLLGNIIISLITLSNTNIIVYIILLVLVNFLNRYLKCNFIAFYMVLLLIVSMILKTNTFNNMIESSFAHSYNLLDYLFGKGIGGIGNTFLVLSIISLFILSFIKEYKSIIPLCGLSIYYIFAIILSLISKDVSTNLILNNNLIFAFIFIAPFSLFSPYTKGAQYIYSILLAIIIFLFSFWNIDLGIYIGIFALSFIHQYLDNLVSLRGKCNF